MYLAIDIGGTKTLLAVFDAHGKVVFEHKTPTDKSYAKFIDDIGLALANELKDYNFGYACCAFPGAIDRRHGVAVRAGNLPWEFEPLKKDLQKLLRHVPVLVENDAKLAGLSEAILVHDKYKKVLYITLSTGIGGGVIINSKIDAVLMDMEPGRTMLEHDGKIQQWEDFASGQALHKRTGKLAAEIDDPKIWQSYARDIALGLEQLLAIIQPEVVIIGGGVGSHFEKFSAPLHVELKKLESAMVRIPPVIKAQRPEEAVIYGCYELIKQQP